jgi:hypothetical protein
MSALALVALLTSGAPATASQEAAIPAELVVPPANVLFMQAEARGVQIYSCQARADNSAVFEWAFRAPEAELLNAQGEHLGQHFAGPTWEGNDGSQVVGMARATADSPTPGAIPWLLLEARSHQGTGVFSTVTYVQRLNTAGGQAPGGGCDSAASGSEARVDYTATYAFYYPAPAGL